MTTHSAVGPENERKPKKACSCVSLIKLYFRVMPWIQALDGVMYFVMGVWFCANSLSTFTICLISVGLFYMIVASLGMISRKVISLFFPWAFFVLMIIAFQLLVVYSLFFQVDYVNELMYNFDEGYEDVTKHLAFDTFSQTTKYSRYTMISTTIAYIVAALSGSIFYSIRLHEAEKKEAMLERKRRQEIV